MERGVFSIPLDLLAHLLDAGRSARLACPTYRGYYTEKHGFVNTFFRDFFSNSCIFVQFFLIISR